ncbi:hypothetical protein RNJ44_01351 [Nakaseomyces bracarensis]|uniref:Uncharacterized protein n=1 Tax=Nakaseomyces bracarensis TaxID=273131 RepID=A0ABR4NPG8_9SACH
MLCKICPCQENGETIDVTNVQGESVQEMIVIPGDNEPGAELQVGGNTRVPNPTNAVQEGRVRLQTIQTIRTIPFLNRYQQAGILSRLEACLERAINASCIRILIPLIRKIDRIISKIISKIQRIIPCMRPTEPPDEETIFNARTTKVKKGKGRGTLLIKADLGKNNKLKIRKLGSNQDVYRIIQLLSESTGNPHTNNINMAQLEGLIGRDMIISEDPKIPCFGIIYRAIDYIMQLYIRIVDAEYVVVVKLLSLIYQFTTVVEDKLYPIKKCIMEALGKPMETEPPIDTTSPIGE